MGKNILYKKLDILSVMEACEDSSKDFILLFMPSNMGGTIGPDAVGEPDAFLYNEYGDTVDKWRRLYIDYSDATFVTKENYINYIKLLAKIIQNAGRILSERGKFCFAVPTIIKYKKYDQEETPDMLFLIKQIFNRVEIADIPAYSPCADIRSVKEAEYGHYTLYICSKDETCEVGKDEYELDDSDDFFVNYKDGLECIPGAAEKVQQWENISSVFSTSIANKLYIKELRQIDFVRKALLNEIPTAAETVAARCAPRLIISQALSLEDRQANYKVKEQLAEKMRQVIDNPDDDIYISDILMGLYCNSNSRVLFPYDRNGHLAWLAQRRNLNWTSLYKVSLRLEECESRDEDPDSFDDEGNNKNGWEIWEDEVAQRHNDFLTIPPLSNKYAGEQENTYETISALPKRIPIQYDENFLLNVAGANAMKAEFAKYSNLIRQVVECTSDDGEESYENVEQAVHAIISLAVRARKGTEIINGDEAEKWFGEGWELLSEQCRNYLQTAAAYEKLSQQSGNVDCAPIAIEYCRALELETNSVVMKPYIDYYYKEGFQKKTYEGDNQAIDKFKKAVKKQKYNSKEGMMLGQIGTCMRNAPDSVDDKNIFYSFKKYCEENGKEQLLDVDVVGEFQLVGKIRNQSAHPSLLDKGCVAQAKQLVRTALKTQLAVEAKFAHSTVLTCAVVCSPKGNKINPNSDKMRKAVANQIEMMAQSGVKIFVLTGKFGFNQIVSDELQKYIKANANKDWGKIMVNNASDKGEASKRQKDALSKAQFCIAYYADDAVPQENDQAASVSATKAMVDDAIKEHGLIVWNAYGIE
jgi:hypothetical protein